MSRGIPVFFSVNPCLIDRFYFLIIHFCLICFMIIYDYKTEGNKERKKKDVIPCSFLHIINTKSC